MGKITIKQVRSENGEKMSQRRTLRALGLRRIRDTVTHEDTPQIRGMITAVSHLVEVVDESD
ncbi:MAG: 50S ribosomal protein L30 [Salinivenus sp.]